MELAEFKSFLKSKPSKAIAEELLFKQTIHAFDTAQAYDAYKNIIKLDHINSYHISIVGSANWKFSLNPKKDFSVFHDDSDIDVAIICADSYLKVWDELRSYHRDNYYSLDERARTSLKRNGENVYAGFASPKWMPNLSSALKRDYLKLTNKYSNNDVKFKSVNMMYFRNITETIDYYVRGIRAATK